MTALDNESPAKSLDSALRASFQEYCEKSARNPLREKDIALLNLCRVSVRKTLTDSDRNGFKSQLRLLQGAAFADGERWSPGLYAARDLSRFAPNPTEQAFALAVEDPETHLPQGPLQGQRFLRTVKLKDAPSEAVKHKNGEGPDPSASVDAVVIRVAYANRLSLEMLVELRKRNVVGVDALDLRSLVEQVPCLRLSDALANVIDVREGSPGFAVIAVVLVFNEAAAHDLNVMRQLGLISAIMRDAEQLEVEPDDAMLDKKLEFIAGYVGRTVKQYEEIVLKALGVDSSENTAKNQDCLKLDKEITVGLRRSSKGQAPFACQAVTTRLRNFRQKITVHEVRIDAYSALRPLKELEKELQKSALAACAWATTSRSAIRGILENAREHARYFNSFDFAVAAEFGEIEPRWVCANESELLGNAYSASLNLQDDHVYNFMVALRAVGHHYDRRLKGQLIKLAHLPALADFFDTEEEFDEE